MAGTIQTEQPKKETEKKIGRTTFIIREIFAPTGVTASEKYKSYVMLDIRKNSI